MPKTCEEKPVSIIMKKGFLAGTLTVPYRRAPKSGWPSVLMCHGFTGNRMEARGVIIIMIHGVLLDGQPPMTAIAGTHDFFSLITRLAKSRHQNGDQQSDN